MQGQWEVTGGTRSTGPALVAGKGDLGEGSSSSELVSSSVKWGSWHLSDRLLWGASEMVLTKHSVHCLAQSGCLIDASRR